MLKMFIDWLFEQKVKECCISGEMMGMCYSVCFYVFFVVDLNGVIVVLVGVVVDVDW